MINFKNTLSIIFAFVGQILITASTAAAQTKPVNYLTNWPVNTSPRIVGNKLALRFLQNKDSMMIASKQPVIVYQEVCSWYGALTFSKANGDQILQNKLIAQFDTLIKQRPDLVPKPNHVDFTVFGAVPLQIYRQTQKNKYKEIGIRFADEQWMLPKDSLGTHAAALQKKGLSWQTRMWIDDMFMISVIQLQAYRATGEKKYLDRAAREMVVYLNLLQRPNGLFYHAPDVPFYWGRGNGWMAAGMTELLTSMPVNHPYRPRILKSYKMMMASLLRYQTASGLWRQLIDVPEAWEETSGTGMFTYAIITGVKKGWLKQSLYGPAARKAWIGLVKHLDTNGDITDICQGTNKKNDRQYYLDRKKVTGDWHGQAPVLWAAAALLQ
ncbi:glycoside hydrolase family 105 protein [Mucilaginibacter sp.]|jgi:rhamnogalacturonyl hydrolase YesR|uniref:glycoside hydrolase family 88/105 protein n=1 Tax=Mucilaginibacter sp. TaxID=1882438 RepID=UPI0035674CF4